MLLLVSLKHFAIFYERRSINNFPCLRWRGRKAAEPRAALCRRPRHKFQLTFMYLQDTAEPLWTPGTTVDSNSRTPPRWNSRLVMKQHSNKRQLALLSKTPPPHARPLCTRISQHCVFCEIPSTTETHYPDHFEVNYAAASVEPAASGSAGAL